MCGAVASCAALVYIQSKERFTVKYVLRNNPLTADPNDCVTQVTDAKSYSKLKFDKTDEEQGVFVTQDGATVRCAQVIENKPSRVVVLLPASVKAGKFTVEVRTKVDNAKRPSKTVKKGVYKKAVTAVAQ